MPFLVCYQLLSRFSKFFVTFLISFPPSSPAGSQTWNWPRWLSLTSHSLCICLPAPSLTPWPWPGRLSAPFSHLGGCLGALCTWAPLFCQHTLFPWPLRLCCPFWSSSLSASSACLLIPGWPCLLLETPVPLRLVLGPSSLTPSALAGVPSRGSITSQVSSPSLHSGFWPCTCCLLNNHLDISRELQLQRIPAPSSPLLCSLAQWTEALPSQLSKLEKEVLFLTLPLHQSLCVVN